MIDTIKIAALALTGLLSTAAATAQPAPAAPAPTVSGDWAVSCEGADTTRICSAVQTLQEDATKTVRVRLSIGRQKASGRHGALATIPLGYRLDAGLMMRIDGKPEGSVDGLIFSRCIAEGCAAEKALTPADIARLKAANTLDLVFLDVAGKPVTVKLSTRGLRQALDQL